MKYPNAAKGVQRIYIAELLKLIAYFSLIAAATIFIISLLSSGVEEVSEVFMNSSVIVSIVLLVIFVVLYLISFIMNLIGFINAFRDDENFKTALIFLIINIVFTIVSVFIISGGFASILYSLATLSDTLATIFVIAGGVNLANQLEYGDVSKKGANVIKLIIIMEAISFVITFITTFMNGSASSMIALIFVLATFVLSIIKYVMYLSFLSKTRKMLKEN